MYGFPLLGGDTVASDRVTVCVAVLGKALSGRSLRRSGARAREPFLQIKITGRPERGGRLSNLKLNL